MKKHITLTILVCFASLFITAQSLEDATKSYEEKAYTKAAKAYKAYLDNEPNVDKTTLMRAAESHYYISNYRWASEYYKRSYKAYGNFTATQMLRFVSSLRSVRDYDNSLELYRSYLKNNQSEEAMQRFNEAVARFDSISTSPYVDRYTIELLSINSKNSDFAPEIVNGDLVFASALPSSTKSIYKRTEQPYLSLQKAQLLEDGTYGQLQPFSQDSFSPYNVATIAMSPTSNIVFFSYNERETRRFKKDDNITIKPFKLYKGELIDGDLKNIEPVYFNSNFYSVGHPAFSKDGKYLYFSSDMPGGYGEADLYRSRIYEDGLIGTYENLGAKINTAGNDMFPAINGNSLYFTSDGHIGYGGLDIFKSRVSIDSNFSNPVNLGKNINSSYDDLSINFKNSTEGFFASNRPGGVGDDDIYSFKISEGENCDNEYIINVISLFEGEALSNATIKVSVEQYNESFELLSDEEGTGRYKRPCQDDIGIQVYKEGFSPSRVLRKSDFNLVKEGVYQTTVDLYNEDDIFEVTSDDTEKLKLAPIFFDIDKWEITRSSSLVLDRVVTLLNAFPELRIKIESHTDARGTEESNLVLSHKRAQASKAYILAQGIAPDRITDARGFGEFRPINECSDNVKCSEAKHLINRRSDFIVVER